MRLVFPLQSVSICHFSGSRVEIIFTANKIIQKRNDGESAKAVREQVFLSEDLQLGGHNVSGVGTNLVHCSCQDTVSTYVAGDIARATPIHAVK